MKKLLLGLTVITSFSLIGCKTQESAYRKAWEKAQAQQAQQAQQVQEQQNNVPVVTIETPVNPADDYQNVNNNVNNDNINNNNNNNYNAYSYNNNEDEYSIANVKRYCVVVGSFESLSGAEQRRQQVINSGYGSAKIIRGGLGYRVVATSFNDIQSAKSSRNSLIRQYDGAWILDTQR